MKKTIQSSRLRLDTQTIQRLVNDELAVAGGGASVNIRSVNFGSCVVSCLPSVKCGPTTSA